MTEQSSYSALTTHRVCPQAWNYQTLRNLERDDPDSVKVELEFGNWWHALRAADSIDRGRKHGTIQSVPRKIKTVDGGPTIETKGSLRAAAVIESAQEWWKTLTQDAQGIWEERIGSGLVERLEYVNDRWYGQWGESIRAEHPVAVEMFWKRHLPESSEGDPETRLVGFIDEVYWDAQRRMLVIRDHKTMKTMNASAEADMMDSQLQVYAWGAAPTIDKFGLGKPRALSYDRVRMVAPKTPSVTTTGTLSKSVTDYDLTTYLRFAAGEDGEGVVWGVEGSHYVTGKRAGEPKWGRYTADPKVIAALSDPAAVSNWLQRTRTPINPNLMKMHLQSAVDTAHDIRRTAARVEANGQAARNLTKNCKWCDFQSLCRAEMVGGTSGEYDLAEHRLRERPVRRKRA